MAPCYLKIGITATWSSKLSLNSLNLICEMNGTLQPLRLPFPIVFESFAPPLLGIFPLDLNMNMNLFLFINIITVCLQYLHACQVTRSAPAE